MLATEDVLYVPSGRSRPKAVSRATGELIGGGAASLSLANTAIAGTDALIADGRLQSYSLGTHLVAVGDAYYVTAGRELLRTKRKEFTAACNERVRIANELRDLEPQAADRRRPSRPDAGADGRTAEARARDRRRRESSGGGRVRRTPA